MLALALVGGAQMMWAEIQPTTTTYDFEDDVPLFTAVAGNGGATRVTVSVATPEGATKAVQFATAGNAANGSAAAKYDFSQLVKNAVKVTVEFDCKLGDYTSGTFSIGDASTRNVAGGKGATGYTNTGAIWSIGINRGRLSGSTTTNNIRINGVDLGATKNSYLKDWIHVQVTVDVTNKKVSYNVTKTGDASDIIASADNVDFVSDAALSCSQIDLFSGTNSLNYYVDNLQIVSYVDNSQKYYYYTVKYLYDDNGTEKEIKESATRNALEGTVPQLVLDDKNAIFYENEKYIYESDNAAELTVGEGTTVKVKFRKADTYTYTVNASYSDKTEELVQGSNFEGETIYAVYPQYYNVGGTLYEASRWSNNTYYKCSFTPTSYGYVHTINYSVTDIKNVVYFSEAEDIEGMTKTTGSNADIRCSYGAGGYSENVVTATTLQPGKYKVRTVVWGKENKSITIKAGETTVHTATTTGSITSAESEEFEIITATPITIEGAASSYPLDYIYIVKTAEVITLPTDYTYSTFCSTSALDFTGNEAVEAYTATADGTTVTLTPVTKVPANTGLILKKLGDATTATVPVAESVDAIGENHLVAVTTPVTAEELVAAGNAYILVSDTQFSKVVSGATGEIPAGKAYLVYNALKGASAMRLYVGEATAAASVEAQAQQAEQAVYTLQGIRVSRPTAKGLYIVDGKVCLFK